MKLNAIAFLCIRVISLYLFFQGLNQITLFFQFSLPTYLQLIEHDADLWKVIVTASIPALIILISSVMIWFSASKLTKLLLPPTTKEAEETINIKGMEAFVLSIIGLIILILSATTLTRLMMSYFDTASLNDSLNMSNRTYLYSIIEQLIRVVTGLVLLLKADGFVLFLRKVRRLGLQRRHES